MFIVITIIIIYTLLLLGGGGIMLIAYSLPIDYQTYTIGNVPVCIHVPTYGNFGNML